MIPSPTEHSLSDSLEQKFRAALRSGRILYLTTVTLSCALLLHFMMDMFWLSNAPGFITREICNLVSLLFGYWWLLRHDELTRGWFGLSCGFGVLAILTIVCGVISETCFQGLPDDLAVGMRRGDWHCIVLIIGAYVWPVFLAWMWFSKNVRVYYRAQTCGADSARTLLKKQQR